MKNIVKEQAGYALSFIDKFREFAMRGNVVDMAVGVIIGAAFGKIVNSLVKDILMPPLGLLMGGINFAQYKIVLKDAVHSSTGTLIQEAVTFNIGAFFQVVFDFIIVAFALFALIQLMARVYKFKKTETKQEKLLAEIRDLLKSKK